MDLLAEHYKSIEENLDILTLTQQVQAQQRTSSGMDQETLVQVRKPSYLLS